MNAVHSKGINPPRGLDALWGVPSKGRRGPEARYTADDVAQAALALADESGVEAVTLSAVARRLGLTTTAVYRYVDTKEVLLELLVDAAIGAPPTLRGRTWEAKVRAWTRALAARYRAHPWLTTVSASGTPRRPSVYAWTEALLGALDSAPEDIDGMGLALLLDAVVRGYAAFSAESSPPPPWLGPAVERTFPRLAAHLARDFSDTDTELDAAVSIVLRGVSPAAD